MTGTSLSRVRALADKVSPLLLIFATVLAHAVATISAPVPVKLRTLPEYIDLTLRRGANGSIPLSASREFNLRRKDIPTKRLHYANSASPDKSDHVFEVVLSHTGGIKQPVALLWTVVTPSVRNRATYIEAYAFETTTEGMLKSAMKSTGKPGATTDVMQSIESQNTLTLFRRELDFHLRWQRCVRRSD